MPSKTNHYFPHAQAFLLNELSDTASMPSLYKKAAEIYAEMLNANEEGEQGRGIAAQASGSFGGILKGWRAGLVQALTLDIIEKIGIDPTRERIRGLQREIFGRGQASKDLKRYAQRRRFGGGRAAPMHKVPDDLREAAYQFFRDHENDLKDAVYGALRS